MTRNARGVLAPLTLGGPAGEGEARPENAIGRDEAEVLPTAPKEKPAEEDWQRGRDELERRIEARTAELARANETLRREVAERQRAEHALRESEQRYRDLYINTPAMLQSFDRDLRLVNVSDYWLKVMGYARDEVIGRFVHEFGTEETRRAILEESIPRLMRTGFIHEVPRQLVKKNGDIMDALVSTVAERRAGGEIAGFLSIIVDVTERAKAEKDLTLAKEQAEVANRAKSEFLANMSHELRTPLNAVIGFADMLGGGFHGVLNSKQTEYVRDIRGAGVELLTLIEDILDLSSIDGGRIQLYEDDIDIRSAAWAAIRIVRARAEAANVGLKLSIARDLPRLRADERVLKRILLNLLTNSIKFTPQGGKVTVAARTGPRGAVCISVADTGIGMAEHVPHPSAARLDHLGAAANRSHDATGLGLRMVRSMAEMHGGSVAVESEPGRGTTVSVHFPAHRTVPRGDA